MNQTEMTLDILKKYIPEYFINDRLSYFDILKKSQEDFPSSNWDSFIASIQKLESINPRQIFIDNESYSTDVYLSRYEEKLKLKRIGNNSYFDHINAYQENEIFPSKPRSRSKYDTIQEGLTIARYIRADLPFAILDIGGGYGRLAEFFLKQKNCIYYMADTFPLSTITAEWYLSHVISPSNIKFLNEKDNENKRLNFITTDQTEYYFDNMKFDFIINVHSMDEMNYETINKIIKLITKSKKPYVYLKNHFTTYNLGENKSEIKDWCELIPFNKWRTLENNYCSEEGVKSHPTFERIFKVEI